MARPRGSRNIRGWMVTPAAMNELGVLTAVKEETTKQGITRVVALDSKKSIDYELAKLNEGEIAQLIEIQKRTKNFSSQLKKHENKIKALPYEVAYVGGKTVGFEKFGQRNRDSVEFTASEMRRMEGKILTHNHPNIWGDGGSSGAIFSGSRTEKMTIGELEMADRRIGNSLSKADLLMLERGRLSEIRAVTESGVVYSVKRSPDFYRRDRNKEVGLVKSAQTRAEKRVKQRLFDLIDQGKMPEPYAFIMYSHFLTRSVAKGSRGKYIYSVQSSNKEALAKIKEMEAIYDGK